MTAVYVEGDTDVPFVKRICESAGIVLREEPVPVGGKDKLDPLLPKLAQSGRHRPLLAFRDLDQDAVSASAWLAANVHPLHPGTFFHLRLAVRAIEAWFLADRACAAACLRVAATAIPLRPDGEDDPELAIVSLARRSTSGTLKASLVPGPGMSRKAGPGYEGWLIGSAADWSLHRARHNSPSLARTLDRLAALGPSLNAAAGF